MITVHSTALLSLLCLPLVGACLSACSKPQLSRRWINLFMALLSGNAALIWLLGDFSKSSNWIFLGNLITFSVSRNAALLYLLTAALAWVFLTRNHTSLSKGQIILTFLSLTFFSAGMFSGQFMIRYIALEIVGLLASLSVMPVSNSQAAFVRFSRMFLTLRLADLALLVSILVLYARSGSLDISVMLEAADRPGIPDSTWVAVGFLIAVLVKTAVWPFDAWLVQAGAIKRQPAYVISGLLLPALGFYLLYRTAPIFREIQPVRFGLYILVIAISILALLVRLIRGSPMSAERLANLALGECALLFCVIGPADFFIWYLLAAFVLRSFFMVMDAREHPVPGYVPGILLLLINSLLFFATRHRASAFEVVLWFSASSFFALWFTLEKKSLGKTPSKESNLPAPSVMQRFFQNSTGWLNEHVEGGVFQLGWSKLGKFFHAFSRWLHRIDAIAITRGGSWLGRQSRRSSRWLYDHVEYGIERLEKSAGEKLVHASDRALQTIEVKSDDQGQVLIKKLVSALQKQDGAAKRRPLQLDLLWIPVVLILLIVLIVS